MILETLLGSPVLIPELLFPYLLKPLLRNSQFWASHVPPMLFPPPRLTEAFEAVQYFLCPIS